MLRTLQGYVKLGNHFLQDKTKQKDKNCRIFTANAIILGTFISLRKKLEHRS